MQPRSSQYESLVVVQHADHDAARRLLHVGLDAIEVAAAAVLHADDFHLAGRRRVTLMLPLMLWIETSLPAASALLPVEIALRDAAAGTASVATRAAEISATHMECPGGGRRWVVSGARGAPRPFEVIVMSPLNVSAVMRAAPPPISKVNRLDVDTPMPCSPGLSVMGNWLSMLPFHVETVSCAFASRGMCSPTSPECVLELVAAGRIDRCRRR